MSAPGTTALKLARTARTATDPVAVAPPARLWQLAEEDAGYFLCDVSVGDHYRHAMVEAGHNGRRCAQAAGPVPGVRLVTGGLMPSEATVRAARPYCRYGSHTPDPTDMCGVPLVYEGRENLWTCPVHGVQWRGELLAKALGYDRHAMLAGPHG